MTYKDKEILPWWCTLGAAQLVSVLFLLVNCVYMHVYVCIFVRVIVLV